MTNNLISELRGLLNESSKPLKEGTYEFDVNGDPDEFAAKAKQRGFTTSFYRGAVRIKTTDKNKLYDFLKKNYDDQIDKAELDSVYLIESKRSLNENLNKEVDKILTALGKISKDLDKMSKEFIKQHKLLESALKKVDENDFEENEEEAAIVVQTIFEDLGDFQDAVRRSYLVAI